MLELRGYSEKGSTSCLGQEGGRREEQDPLEILEFAKEHCDKTVPMDILGGTSFQKHVGFIQKKRNKSQ